MLFLLFLPFAPLHSTLPFQTDSSSEVQVSDFGPLPRVSVHVSSLLLSLARDWGLRGLFPTLEIREERKINGVTHPATRISLRFASCLSIMFLYLLLDFIFVLERGSLAGIFCSMREPANNVHKITHTKKCNFEMK